MSALEAASLTSALLVRKGAAVPAGYATLVSTVRGLRAPEPSTLGRELPAEGTTASVQRARRKSAPDPRARISLRLDDDRHLKLKLTSAHLHRSLQDILIAALDGYLDQVGPAVMNGNCACLDGGCAARGLEIEQG